MALAPLNPETRNLIDGRLVGASNGRTFDNVNPATEEVVGTCADGTREDMHAAIAAARRAFDETDWSTDAAFRKKCLLQLCEARPHRVTRFVNIDGMPSLRRAPDVADHERTRMLENEISGWLDRRLRANELQRPAGTLDDLAKRRGRMNPRMSHDWLRYLVTRGALVGEPAERAPGEQRHRHEDRQREQQQRDADPPHPEKR